MKYTIIVFLLFIGFTANSQFTGTTTFGSEKQQIGLRYAYSWATTPLSSEIQDVTGSATVTTDGIGTIVDGGGWNLSNYLQLTPVGFVSPHNWILTSRVQVLQKSLTTYGFSFSFAAGGVGQSAMCHFLLSDTTGYISFTNGNALPAWNNAMSNKGVLFYWDTLDILQVTIHRVGEVLYIYLDNLTKKVGISHKIPDTHLSAANARFYTYGSKWKLIGSTSLWYTDIQYPKFVTMGMSVTLGGVAVNRSTRWTSKVLDGADGGWQDHSASAEKSADGVNRMYDITHYVIPEYLIVEYGINDRNGLIPPPTYAINMQKIADSAKAYGIKPIFISTVPQTLGSVFPYNDSLKAICARDTIMYIDITTPMLSRLGGFAMDAIFNSGDGIHPNQKGHDIMASVIRAKLDSAGILSYGSPMKIFGAPVSNLAQYYLGLNDNKEVVLMYRGKDTMYVENVWELSAQSASPGNVNKLGGMWIWGEFRAGGGAGAVNANPMFKVSTSGVSAGNFVSRGLNVDGGGITIGNASNPNIFTWDLRSYQRPLTINFNFPTTAGNNGLILNTTNNDNGGVLHSSYKFLQFRNNGATKGWFDRAGGYHPDSIIQYNSNIGALISLNDRNVPDIGWIKANLSSLLPSGTATLSSGTITISSTTILSNSKVYITNTNCVNCGVIFVSSITPGVGFTVESSNASDGSSFNWLFL